ncbi:hypothetical protein LAZ67_3000997 [Cordylochernes scorpioides]|uniref:Integrase catalytic domain-containing protein n=1 Tax=Cordylochernes scorpioides TaxID=51811 RepID=A0ABY6K6N3_9ARAC|nr:hypothetical protein LAZ67_3000997 [Cordylochernes scorpioides]
MLPEKALVLCSPKYKGEMIYDQWHLPSRTLTQAEKKYSQLEREALGIIFGVTRFRNYLLGNSFTLRTDHKPLVTLFSENKGIPTIAGNRIQRWAIILSAYQYKIEYIKGTSNTEADVLSQLPMFTLEQNPKEHDSEPVEMVLLMDALDSSPVTSDDIWANLPGDPALRQALDHTLQVEACTKWIEAIPVPNTSTRETIEQLCCLFARFGIPRTLVSDIGTGFTYEEFRQFMTRNGIHHFPSPTDCPFHPSSNGLAERAVQTIKTGLKKVQQGSISLRYFWAIEGPP